MPKDDDLDELFHSHPRLRKYAEMFDEQKSRNVSRQQRVAWIALAITLAVLWYWMAQRTGSWNPLSWQRVLGHGHG